MSEVSPFNNLFDRDYAAIHRCGMSHTVKCRIMNCCVLQQFSAESFEHFAASECVDQFTSFCFLLIWNVCFDTVKQAFH